MSMQAADTPVALVTGAGANKGIGLETVRRLIEAGYRVYLAARGSAHMRINAAEPGMTATDLSGGQGHPVQDGTDAIIAFAFETPGGATGAYRVRHGELSW
ncbi:hypothetical protein [Actinomadura bangladeshensis]|uniref:SDR family NAD(P)-dependent oxidoreductase n=1 Tax=Actinomadura bangladeshensis TaxID=453573 RepID=A0A4R4NYV0_9ACTN|nr:hypothetical protein [Actinomadura bangladeshensis]TDC13410.1 hypothetical protein E1284_20355 [Actinomadura bangladeshensis]